jgi:hypothetical protein
MSSESVPKHETGNTVLARMGNDTIESFRIAGKQVGLDMMGTVTPGEYVGVPEGAGLDDIHIVQAVESSTLAPEAQEDLAREKSGLPLRGDIIIAKINGRLTEATVVDYTLDSKDRKVAIVKDPLSGEQIAADLRAFTPEIQAAMDRDFKKQEFGGNILETVRVAKPITEVAPEAQPEPEPSNIDNMLDPNYDGFTSTADAAVRPVETEEEKNLRELLVLHQKRAQNAQIQTNADDFRGL